VIVRPVLCRPFIGRREELAFLYRQRREAGSSRGNLVFVSGDAGLGKSRLIAEFCRTFTYSRWRIAQGSCTEFARRPYGPILAALARVDPAAADLVPAETKQEQIDEIIARFAASSTRNALVVTIEDIHWADAATLDLLAHLGSRIRTMRILVIASFRPEDLHPDSATSAAVARITRSAQASRIDLAPLAGLELKTFVDEALSDVTLPERVRRELARAGEGNPFFTEELLRSAVERGGAVATRPARPLPQTLRAVLLERLRPFDAGEQRVIAQAAVIGRTFGLDLLATTLQTPPERLLPTLRRARDVQLLEEVEAKQFRFRHFLTREAIYGDFLTAQLQPLHRTVALALEDAPEQDRSVEELAYHWWSAGDAVRSAHFNELAGDAAASVYAHEDAIAFYERALESSSLALVARGALLEKIAERRIALTWTEEGKATYEAAADLFRAAGNFEREAACRVHAALMAYITGQREPTAALETMLARLDVGEHVARSRAHLGIAWIAVTLGFPTKAAGEIAQVDARALAEAPDIRLRFHNVSAWVAMTLGDVDTFYREHAAWLEAARESGSIRTYVAAHLNGAMCLSNFCLHDEALDHIEAAFRISRDARNPYTEEACHAFAAPCFLSAGDLASVRAHVNAIPTTTENHVNFTFAAAWGTIAGAYLDDHELIQRWFDGFESGVRLLEQECGAGFAELMSRRGRERDAAELLHRLLPDCEMLPGNIPTLLAVARYGRADDRVRAREYLARGAAARVELPERPALALFDAIEARRANRPDQVRAHSGEAADGFRRLRLPLLEAAALELAGDLDAALILYRRCGALYEVRRLGGAAESAAVPLPDGLDAGTPLSGREREIALLAARGRSNLEIARELAISHKTVEKHLASTFQKLGISSRRELRSIEPAAPPTHSVV
jgi:DNA-binding CsgD family transcriptional regulator